MGCGSTCCSTEQPVIHGFLEVDKQVLVLNDAQSGAKQLKGTSFWFVSALEAIE